MALLQVHHLDQWSRTVDSRDRLGQLVLQLVGASLPFGTIRYIRFLHGSATQLSGWDGELETSSSNQFVPGGKSVWELGTSDLAKIRSDFEKRKTEALPSSWLREDTTYVAVTLAKLQDAAGIAEELAKLEVWKHVVVIDSVSLVHWLELSSSVDAWAYEMATGSSPKGMQSLSFASKAWTAITKPPIEPQLLTAGRKADIEQVKETITSGTGLQLNADSPDEGISVIYSALLDLDENRRNSLLSRAVVISNIDAAATFPNQLSQLVLLKGEANAHVFRLESAGHQVIQIHGKTARSRRTGMQLLRQTSRDFADALKGMGLTSERAEIEARVCGSSASVWRIWNLYSEGDASGVLPEWANLGHIDVVVPAVLLGGWSEANTRDVAIVEAVTGRRYEEFRDRLIALNQLGEPLVEVIGDTIVVSAPAPAFALASGSIGREVLTRFTTQVREVFSETDPLLDVEASERAYAAGESRAQRNSSWLRDGMAGTLLRITVLGRKLEESGALGAGVTGQQYVDQFLRTLPGLRDNYRLIASLRDQLPVLAEAAPTTFMEALEALLRGDRDGLVKLFAEDSEFGNALHPSLLWAVETIAWDSQYLGRAVLLLGGLDAIDPGGRLSNRPLNSIVDILLPWFPGTSASVKQRIHTLDALVEKYPDGAWRAVQKLLPTSQGSTSGTHRPEWKETGRSKDTPVARAELIELYSAYIARALSMASGNPARLMALVDKYPHFSADFRTRFEEELRKVAGKLDQEGELVELWKTLREFVSRNRQFKDSTWALKSAELAQLEQITRAIEPKDLIKRDLWLFSDPMPDLPDFDDDHSSYTAEVKKRREDSARKLWLDPDRVGKVLALARASGYPGIVADAVTTALSTVDEFLSLYDRTCLGDRADRLFASVISANAVKLFGLEWDALIESKAKSSADYVNYLVSSLYGRDNTLQLFEQVASFGLEVESEFWLRHDGFVRTDDPKVSGFAVRKLAQFGRARDAVVIIGQDKSDLTSDQILAVLKAAIPEINRGEKPRIPTSFTFWVEKVFELLRSNPGVNRSEIAAVEYVYLPAIVTGLDKEDLALHEEMSSDPAFFVRVLSDLYKKEHEKESGDERLTDERRIRAKLAWHLLQSWRRVPGLLPDASLDGASFRNWITEARRIAAEADRTTMADQQIGHVLYHAPKEGTDGAWPHLYVRELLEDLQNENIETGIRIEQFNARGVTSRSLLEGGTQERRLSMQWHDWAKTVGARWPRTQALLLDIATSWDKEASREDDEAAKNRIRMST